MGKEVKVYKFEDMFEVVNGRAVIKDQGVTYIIMNAIDIAEGLKSKGSE